MTLSVEKAIMIVISILLNYKHLTILTRPKMWEKDNRSKTYRVFLFLNTFVENLHTEIRLTVQMKLPSLLHHTPSRVVHTLLHYDKLFALVINLVYYKSPVFVELSKPSTPDYIWRNKYFAGIVKSNKGFYYFPVNHKAFFSNCSQGMEG